MPTLTEDRSAPSRVPIERTAPVIFSATSIAAPAGGDQSPRPRTRRHRAGGVSLVRRAPSSSRATATSSCAGLVAVEVVDLLEAVDVEEDHRAGELGAARLADGAAELLEEGPPVEETGERVGAGEADELGLALLALDGVADGAEQRPRLDLALVEIVAGAEAERLRRDGEVGRPVRTTMATSAGRADLRPSRPLESGRPRSRAPRRAPRRRTDLRLGEAAGGGDVAASRASAPASRARSMSAGRRDCPDEEDGEVAESIIGPCGG